MTHFGPKNGTPSSFYICSKDFFQILHHKRDQEGHGNYINGFSKKILIWGKWDILDLKMGCLNDFGSTQRIFLKILHNIRGQEVHENYLIVFLKQYNYGQIGLFEKFFSLEQ